MKKLSSRFSYLFANPMKGFTLIELLVVIAIIAILSTVGLTAFTNAQQRGRDAKRQGDMKDIKNAFEQYYSANNSLYAAPNTMATSYLQGGATPADPRAPTQTYTIGTNATNTGYCACAYLETLGKGNATALGGCATGGAPTWGTVAANARGYQCVVNAQ